MKNINKKKIVVSYFYSVLLEIDKFAGYGVWTHWWCVRNWIRYHIAILYHAFDMVVTFFFFFLISSK